jgi:hypothetical protein
VYRNIRYTLDRTHPLQVPCAGRAVNLAFALFFVVDFRYMPAVEAVGMWESQRDFQRMWEGWKAGFLAFHTFHILSFPWPALECVVKERSYRKSRFQGTPPKIQDTQGCITSGLATIHPRLS